MASLLGEDVRQQLYRAEASGGSAAACSSVHTRSLWLALARVGACGRASPVLWRSVPRRAPAAPRSLSAHPTPPPPRPPQVTARLTDGTGDFSRERMLQELPEQLGLDGGKAEKVVVELAKDKKHTTLVQVR